MRERKADFDRLGAMVAGVAFEPPNQIGGYLEANPLPFPVFSDPERRAYREFGFARGSVRRIWTRETLRPYWDSLRSGHIPRIHPADFHQLGGDVALDASGRVAFLHRSQQPSDRPSADSILNALRQATPADEEEA